VVYWSCRV